MFTATSKSPYEIRRALFAIGSCFFVRHIKFDGNLLNLLPPNLESTRYAIKIVQSTGAATWFGAIVAHINQTGGADRWMLCYTRAIIFAILIFTYRNIILTQATLYPLLLTILWTIGFMKLFRIQLNPADQCPFL